MMIIGVDYHPSFQTIAFLMEETGECGEQELNHSDGEAEKFYRDLQQRGISVRVGLEATGYSRWFERLLAELGFEVWIGDPAVIKTKRVRKQKTDREDARLMRKLLLENRFPRIWVPSPENRDLRQLLWHRHRLVQMRTRIMNQLQAVAMNEGYRWKKKLFSQQGRALLEKLSLAPWATGDGDRNSGRRNDIRADGDFDGELAWRWKASAGRRRRGAKSNRQAEASPRLDDRHSTPKKKVQAKERAI